MVEKTEEKLLAYHDAGHAVAGHVLGLTVEGLSIVPDEHYAGLADVPVDLDSAYGSPEESDDYLRRHLVCFLAGAVAEEILTGEPVELGPGSMYRGDWNGATDCVVALAGKDVKRQAAESEEAFTKTRAILRENWAVVVALAEALIEHRELTREQVLAIVG
jgi:ATP-dependent Zn protease